MAIIIGANVLPEVVPFLILAGKKVVLPTLQ